jgi:hypothetical protein
MKHWIYVEPARGSSEPIWTIMSEDAVIAEYWSSWEKRMKANNKSEGLPEFANITRGNCIYDWVVTHWAIEATPESLLRIIGHE